MQLIHLHNKSMIQFVLYRQTTNFRHCCTWFRDNAFSLFLTHGYLMPEDGRVDGNIWAHTFHLGIYFTWVYLVLWFFNLFCNVWVSVCAGFAMCGCFGNMCTCIYCVLYYFYCVFVLFRLCTFILNCFVCTGVRTTATEWQLNCSK
jgi:hypothetical protein